ncbi:hypothetical protein [Kitasatospora griseola]|uniref:hypothetical protein n=1 Tax=Kitasatospora griseola TaxID=2064 RepID=UPI0016705717|nr:hypothetical protein [Kitasatospora griseola]GGR01906.1 hypothetical protein GCM10010195_67070 [Kitasatospora griseola]
MNEIASVDVHQSKIAAFLRSLDPAVLSALQIGEAEIIAIDLIVSGCSTMTEIGDSRHWSERLESFFSQIPEEKLETLARYVVEGNLEELLAEIHRRATSGMYSMFVLRLLGAARYRAMLTAAKQDGAVVSLVLRRLIRSVMPFAVAWGDAVGLMSKAQVKAATQLDTRILLNAVQLVVDVDAFFGEKVLTGLPMQETSATTDDLEIWDPRAAPQFTQTFRALISDATVKRVERANSGLVKKIRGARHALQYSEDGISQAANSLIELIDRILREAFPQETSLAWVHANFDDFDGLTHIEKGVEKPTKLAEALCFVYGGGPRPEPIAVNGVEQAGSVVHEMIARVIVTARNHLQKMKHADAGTQEEREQLLRILAAVEGALMIGLVLGGVKADPEPA